MAIRDLNELDPQTHDLAQKFIDAFKTETGLDILVTETFRSADDQDKVYEQGRSLPGTIVTNAKGGESNHQFRCAFDICPKDPKTGALLWNREELFLKAGQIGRKVGLEWGGDWSSFKDRPHFQYTQGQSTKQLQAKYGRERPKTW